MYKTMYGIQWGLINNIKTFLKQNTQELRYIYFESFRRFGRFDRSFFSALINVPKLFKIKSLDV